MIRQAVGIHAHDRFKLGRRPPKNAPALRLADVLTGVAPLHPASVDHIASNQFGLYANDQFGDCGPVSVANLVRLITAGLLGAELKPTQEDVFDLYRRSGNPDFDPKTGAGDNGVDMQTMLEALLADGIGGIKPLCFAKVDVSNDAELDAAVSIFGGVLWGVNLLVPQQTQTDLGQWDYVPGSEWGGHAVMNGAFSEATWVDYVITWGDSVTVTGPFRRHQLEEAWVVVWQWNLEHPAFQEGIDAQALADAYHELTGRTIPNLPVPTPPAPGGGENLGPFQVGPFSARVAGQLAARAAYHEMTIEQYLTYHIQFGSGHWRH